MSDRTDCVVPPGWANATIDDVTRRDVRQDGPKFGGGFRYVDIGSIDNSTKRVTQARTLPASNAPSRARQNLVLDDVLVSMTRPNLNSVALVSKGLEESVASTGFHVLRAEGVEPSWLFYAVQTRSFINAMSSVVQGALYPAVRPKDIRCWSLPIPPRVEQQRIIGALEELLSDLDAGVAALERVRAKLAQYRASVLKAAVDGTLTAGWRAAHPNTEPATELLKRILVERRQRWEEEQLRKFKEKGQEPPKNWKAKYKTLTAPDATVLPPMPDGWLWATIDQCAFVLQYGTSAKATHEVAGVPVLRMGNLTSDGRLVLDDLKYLPTKHSEFPELLLQPDDLLFNRTNSSELVGKMARYRGLPDPCSFASYLIRLRLVTSVHPQILVYSMTSMLGRQWVKAVANQTVGQANVNGTKLAGFAWPVPPSLEQEAIVDVAEDHLSVIEHLESDIRARLKNAQGLRQALLRHAFSGQLVPQDPNDEPASELLKRIAAGREVRTHEADKIRPAKPLKRALKTPPRLRQKKREAEAN